MPVQFPAIPAPVRAYFYRVVAVALGVAVLKGWVEADEVEVYLLAAATVLAVANTSTKNDAGQSVLVVAAVAAVVCFVLLLVLDVIRVH